MRLCSASDCDADISHKRSDARTCSIRCKQKAHRDAHPEKYRAKDAKRRQSPEFRKRAAQRVAQWRIDNADRNAANIAKWRIDHRDRYLESMARWQRNNPDRVRLYQNDRRARHSGNPTYEFTEKDWLRLVARFRGRCAYCDQKREDLELEHVIPVSRGGVNGAGNYLPACPTCNRSKGGLLLIEWRYRKGMCK